MTIPTRARSVPSRVAAAAAAVALAVLSSAVAAHAQTRVGSDGHALDASNRVGAGGYNGPTQNHYNNGINSQISTGNVTGLNYFHNSTGTFDPNVIRTNTNDGAVQAFTQISAPVNYAQRATGAPNFSTYYNTAQYTGQLPQNYVPTKNNVGIIDAPRVSPLTPSTDTRLQNLNDPILNESANLPTPTQATGSGPVNPVGNPTVYSMSPLYGVRQLQPGDTAALSNAYSDRFGSTSRTTGNGPHVDAGRIQKMQDELNDTAVPNGAGIGGTDGSGSTGMASPTAVTYGNAQPDGPATPGQVPTGQFGSTANVSKPFGAALSAAPVPTQSTGTLSKITQHLQIAPGQQSEQLAKLQQRFAQATPNPTAPQAQQQMTQMSLLLKRQQADAAKVRSAAGQPTVAGAGSDTSAFGKGGFGSGSPTAMAPAAPPTAAGKAELPLAARDPAAPTDGPFIISSLATGIRAKGLADLMGTAEKQMRSGQFAQAVDSYDTAGEVAPNNPFVPLGRGFAELGASFYGRAETDLTHAILLEPAVLAGQYDLKGFLGDTRLKFVQQDLTGIAKTENTARPHLLLAYLAHNTGQDDMKVTAPQLDAAAAAGADAKVIGLMREAWNLKAPAGK